MKKVFYVVVIIVLGFAVSSLIIYFVFGDEKLLTAPKIVSWVFISALITGIICLRDSQPKQ